MSMRRLLCLGAATIWPGYAAAQTPASVDSVVVTASRVGAAAASPYALAVIEGEPLAARQSVADALSGVADIHVQAPGGRSGVSSIFLRGADPNFTVVQLDGVPLTATTNSRGGAVNVSELDVAGIERVEVVAGPLSSLYGSGALAGVINLIVPGGAPDHRFTTSAALGSDQDYAVALGWRGPLAGSFGGSLTAAVSDDGSVYSGSKFRTWSVTGKAAADESPESARLVFKISRNRAHSFPDSSGGPRFATLTELETREGRETLVGLRAPIMELGRLRIVADAAYLARRDSVVTPGVAPSAFDDFGVPAGEDRSRYERLSAGLGARVNGGNWAGAAGLEAQVEDGRSDGFMDFFGFHMPTGFKLERTSLAAFAEVGRSAGGLDLNAGVRVDDPEGLEREVTARAGLRYAVPGAPLVLRASGGTGYKAPSFYALGNPFVGNPTLRPEKSRAAEASVEWTIAEGSVATLTVFHARYTDLIDFVPGPPPQLQNRKLVVSQGASAALTWALSPTLAAAIQATYADTQDDDTGEQLLSRPTWRTASSLSWRPHEALLLTARHSYVGPRKDYAIPVGPRRLDGYSVVSTDAALTIHPQTIARLSIDNVLDNDYEAAIGFPSPGLRARLAISQEF